MVGTTAAILGSAAIGGGTSLLGGLFGSRAANSAAKIQAAAAQQVANDAKAAGNEAADYVTGAANQGMERVEGATNDANALLQQYAQGLNPYLQAGEQGVTSLAELLSPNGALMQAPNASDIANDPGFQFRMQQGLKALERGAAARGGAMGTGAMDRAQRYASGLASDEYQRAFDRFQTNRTNTVSALGSLIGVGQNALGMQGNVVGQQAGNLTRRGEFQSTMGLQGATTAGGLKMGAQQIAGDAITGGANAQAAGKVGAANAWSGALGGVGNAAMGAGQMLTLQSLMQQPQPAGGWTNAGRLPGLPPTFAIPGSK